MWTSIWKAVATLISGPRRPLIFFEGAPNFGFNNGTVNVTLAATRHLVSDEVPSSDIVAVGYLR
jgi:hypothetical protein